MNNIISNVWLLIVVALIVPLQVYGMHGRKFSGHRHQGPIGWHHHARPGRRGGPIHWQRPIVLPPHVVAPVAAQPVINVQQMPLPVQLSPQMHRRFHGKWVAFHHGPEWGPRRGLWQPGHIPFYRPGTCWQNWGCLKWRRNYGWGFWKPDTPDLTDSPAVKQGNETVLDMPWWDIENKTNNIITAYTIDGSTSVSIPPGVKNRLARWGNTVFVLVGPGFAKPYSNITDNDVTVTDPSSNGQYVVTVGTVSQ